MIGKGHQVSTLREICYSPKTKGSYLYHHLKSTEALPPVLPSRPTRLLLWILSCAHNSVSATVFMQHVVWRQWGSGHLKIWGICGMSGKRWATDRSAGSETWLTYITKPLLKIILAVFASGFLLGDKFSHRKMPWRLTMVCCDTCVSFQGLCYLLTGTRRLHLCVSGCRNYHSVMMSLALVVQHLFMNEWRYQFTKGPFCLYTYNLYPLCTSVQYSKHQIKVLLWFFPLMQHDKWDLRDKLHTVDRRISKKCLKPIT